MRTWCEVRNFASQKFRFTPESKICEKTDVEPESLFNFGSCRNLCGHFLSKTWVHYDWIDDCNRSLNRSRILKFKNFQIRVQNFGIGAESESEKSDSGHLCNILISNTLRKLMIGVKGFVFRLICRVSLLWHLTSNQKVIIYTTRIKKLIAKLYSFTLRSSITDKN